MSAWLGTRRGRRRLEDPSLIWPQRRSIKATGLGHARFLVKVPSANAIVVCAQSFGIPEDEAHRAEWEGDSDSGGGSDSAPPVLMLDGAKRILRKTHAWMCSTAFGCVCVQGILITGVIQ
ncbi:hypothetical protein EDD18DRAFT_1108837 [Armillaria luteobubalina]|uniref:Uncharacterized protein n=1 Tax=Armillaria luteobubalina TaxID=153913 RepID=A0AA39PXJ8_9AGAR|nr:hypothetical protein EDD18DRAFT_1108837 [Armillaria luteobubalina]